MAVAAQEWLDLIEREYLRDFVTDGGAAVKFAVRDCDQLAALGGMLAELSERHRLAHVWAARAAAGAGPGRVNHGGDHDSR